MVDTDIKTAPAKRADAAVSHVALASPRHVAIIMDGNGRWAKERGLPRAVGHSKGVEAVRRTVQAAIELGVKYLTIYSFSSENWSRPPDEVADLMGLIKRFIRRDLADLHRSGVAVQVIGGREELDTELRGMIEEAERLTAGNSALKLVVAFNYGSRAEIARAARRLALDAAAGRIDAAAIDEGLLSASLDTAGMPEPDLLIRTGGELRLSNFLLWQSAYTEFVFLDNYWPEFGRELLGKAIAEYHQRDRRYGGLSKQSTA